MDKDPNKPADQRGGKDRRQDRRSRLWRAGAPVNDRRKDKPQPK